MRDSVDLLGGIPKEAWDDIESQIAELAKDQPPGWKYGQKFLLDATGKVSIISEDNHEQ
jgi:hypothetical protein